MKRKWILLLCWLFGHKRGSIYSQYYMKHSVDITINFCRRCYEMETYVPRSEKAQKERRECLAYHLEKHPYLVMKLPRLNRKTKKILME